MTESIESMAREAGLFCDKGHWFSPAGDPEDEVDVSTEDLTRFAALVRAQALDDAARVCESRQTPGTGSVAILRGAADEIRALPPSE